MVDGYWLVPFVGHCYFVIGFPFLEFVLFLALVDIYCTFGNISYRCPLFTTVYKVFLAVFWNELTI